MSAHIETNGNINDVNTIETTTKCNPIITCSISLLIFLYFVACVTMTTSIDNIENTKYT